MFLDEKFMEIAIKEAKIAYEENEIPVGAVLIDNFSHEVIAKAHNSKEKKNDITGHAEINVIKKAEKKLKNWRLENTTLYVTLEPCPMCMSAILQARISRVVYMLNDKELGAAHSKIDLTKIYKTNTTVFKIEENSEYYKIFQDFFKKHRK